MGVNEVTTHIPEHTSLGSWWNDRARGLGATVDRPVSTAGEENALCYRLDHFYSLESKRMIELTQTSESELIRKRLTYSFSVILFHIYKYFACMATIILCVIGGIVCKIENNNDMIVIDHGWMIKHHH